MKLSNKARHYAAPRARNLKDVGGRGKSPTITNKCRPGGRFSFGPMPAPEQQTKGRAERAMGIGMLATIVNAIKRRGVIAVKKGA